MTRAACRGQVLAVWLAACAIGCATVPPRGGASSPLPSGPATSASPSPAATPAPTPAKVSPMPGTTVGTTASGGQITTTSSVPAVLDTLPSADAKAVLETIPEPLPAGERVPPRVPATRSTPTPSTPADSVAAPPDSSKADGESDVPVPEPTRPLGERPSPAAADSAPPASPHPNAPAAPPSSAARPDSCWRVQVAAVPESERADKLRSAAESQLVVPCVVQKEGALYKVRTRDCEGAAAADLLRKRAVAAGFSGAFRFRDRAP